MVSCNSKKENPVMAEEKVVTKDADLDELAKEAYIYGYSLLLMDETLKNLSNHEAPDESGAPKNQFYHAQRFADYKSTLVVSTNVDTLYSGSALDLRKEPYILSIPEIKNRYYIFELLDAWTNVIASPNSIDNGEKAQNYAIVGPFWEGKLPDDVIELKSPTNDVFLIGRTRAENTPEDIKIVAELQKKYKLTPLSAWGTNYQAPKKVPVDPNIDITKSPKEKVAEMDAQTYYSTLARLMKDSPAYSYDKPMLEKLEKLGIVPGENFDINKLKPEVKLALENSIKNGQQLLDKLSKTTAKMENGWSVELKGGNYGTNYANRAAIAYFAIGENLAKDAIYPTVGVDSHGQQLNGKNKYILHFDSAKLPVRGFWSLTLYNEKQLLNKNILNRYLLRSDDNLKLNPDGSLDIYIQFESPGKDKESNWLPSSENDFSVMLRLYAPDESILNEKWIIPGIKKVN